MRVIVADDNAVVRVTLRGLLTLCGCDVDVVDGGHEAVELAARQRYDLALVDMQMPGLDGVATVYALRSMDRPAAVPRIVVMTADLTPEDREDCLAVGVTDFLEKPVRLAELRRLIANVGSPASPPRRATA